MYGVGMGSSCASDDAMFTMLYYHRAETAICSPTLRFGLRAASDQTARSTVSDVRFGPSVDSRVSVKSQNVTLFRTAQNAQYEDNLSDVGIFLLMNTETNHRISMYSSIRQIPY